MSLWAGEPTERIKTAVDSLITILSDESLRPSTMKEKRDRMIMEVVDGIFNWEEFSKSALGIYWAGRTEEEKKEFVPLLRQLITNAYIGYAPRYSGEKIIFVGEKIEDRYGAVSGEVVTSKGTRIPIEFRITRKGGVWWIYDINVLGLSLAGYYRNQINAIITRSSYEELIRGLREKVKAR